jgi:uncharacterized membrane protein
MLKAIGWCIVAVVGIVMCVNACYMVASPRAWFRLPHWIGAQGSLTETKYATGLGAILVRLTGALLLAVIAWVLYDSLLRPR